MTVHDAQALAAFHRATEDTDSAAPEVAAALRDLLSAVEKLSGPARAEGIEQLALLAAQCSHPPATRQRPTARALSSALLVGVEGKLLDTDGWRVWRTSGAVVRAHLMTFVGP